MEIIHREALMSVFSLKKIETDIDWIIKHFLYNYDEVLYFVDGRYLKAVVSIGDLFHYLEGKSKEILNVNFTKVSETNTDIAKEFFQKHPTIHELPIISSSGYFSGIIKFGNSNTEYLWNGFRSHIRSLYYGISSYYLEASLKLKKHFKGRIFFANLPVENKVFEHLKDDEDKRIYIQQHVVPPLEQLENMPVQRELDYWGGYYEPGISKKFAREFFNIKTFEKNGCQYYENSEQEHYITFEKGKRRVINKKEGCKRKIYLVGPCTVFGAYVADNQTIEYYLQGLLNNADYCYQVVNFGSLGLYYEFQYLLTECLSDEDIIIILSQSEELISIMGKQDNSFYLGDYSEIYNIIPNPMSCILDTFRHVNYKISEEIAKHIYTSIEPYLDINENIQYPKRPIQDYFISWEIVAYYKDFALNNNLANMNGLVGAIVMNCNPFTQGHRYLIEYASKIVDTLIIFVVEEDASVFSFTDRIEMVKLGTADIANIKVVPSGKYNISKSTFAQYFEKEKQISQIDSMEYDLRVFCEVIAECMNISFRFAGEEPIDIITKKYNETMKDILPQYGVNFIEIPRMKSVKEKAYISASKVREYLKQGKWDSIAEFLPETTIDYIKRVNGNFKIT